MNKKTNKFSPIMLFNNIKSKMKVYLFSLLTVISPKINSKFVYKRTFNKKLNIKNPELFNEKLMYLKLFEYSKNELVIQCSDKYEVRKYVIDKGYKEILNELYGVYNNASEIQWDKLPNKFVIKWNFGSSLNMFCTDKSKFNISSAKKTLRKWSKKTPWLLYSEMHCKYIRKKIICEKYIENRDGTPLMDYKLFCFNGEPLFLSCIIFDDVETKSFKRMFFDFNWNPYKYAKNDSTIDIKDFKKPKNLNKMYEIAKNLSSPFPFVRVDLYEVDGKIIFGELTFTPTGCRGTYFANEGNIELGKKIILNNKKTT